MAAWQASNNSFKPTPCRGIGHVLYATLAHVRRPDTGRLNSGVRPHKIMMTLYHLDVAGRLQEGMHINLSPGSLSWLGRTYTAKFRRYDVLKVLETGQLPAELARLDPATFREFALEFLRLHYAPVKNLNRPSRLWSFFATESPDDAIRYADRHEYHGEKRVFEVHTSGEHPCLDMTWLDRSFPNEISGGVLRHMQNYWAGELFENHQQLGFEDTRGSLCERLITSPITIGRIVQSAA